MSSGVYYKKKSWARRGEQICSSYNREASLALCRPYSRFSCYAIVTLRNNISDDIFHIKRKTILAKSYIFCVTQISALENEKW
jgi:hypothetical protein